MDVQIAYAALLLTSAPGRSSSHIWMCSYLVHFNYVHLCTSRAQLTHKDSQDAVFIQNWEVYYTSGWLRSRNLIYS